MSTLRCASGPRRLGKSDLSVGPLAYGCWRFAGTGVAEARAKIEAALDLGMTLVDTADIYGLDDGRPVGDAEGPACGPEPRLEIELGGEVQVDLANARSDQDGQCGPGDRPDRVVHLNLPADADVVIGGHLHIAMDPPKVIESEVAVNRDGSPKKVIVCHSGAFAKFVGRLDLVVRDGEVLSHDYTLFPVDNRVAENGDMLELIEPYERRMNQELDLDRIVAVASERIRRFGVSGGDRLSG